MGVHQYLYMASQRTGPENVSINRWQRIIYPLPWQYNLSMGRIWGSWAMGSSLASAKKESGLCVWGKDSILWVCFQPKPNTDRRCVLWGQLAAKSSLLGPLIFLPCPLTGPATPPSERLPKKRPTDISIESQQDNLFYNRQDWILWNKFNWIFMHSVFLLLSTQTMLIESINSLVLIISSHFSSNNKMKQKYFQLLAKGIAIYCGTRTLAFLLFPFITSPTVNKNNNSNINRTITRISKDSNIPLVQN